MGNSLTTKTWFMPQNEVGDVINIPKKGVKRMAINCYVCPLVTGKDIMGINCSKRDLGHKIRTL